MSAMSKEFAWNDLGDIRVGRPNLGTETDVMVYRSFQFSIRHILVDNFGLEHTEQLMRDAGEVAGREFAANHLDRDMLLFDYFADLQRKPAELKVGMLRMQKADADRLEFVLTVSEDLDCSGLPIAGMPVCNFDESLISGIMEHCAGRKFSVKEVDCWAAGAKTCRFAVKVLDR